MDDAHKIKIAKTFGKDKPEDCPAFYAPVFDSYARLSHSICSKNEINHTERPILALIAELLRERDETIRLFGERLQAVEAALDVDEDSATPARRGPGRPKKELVSV